jgi:RHS repeat-associated protein
VTNGVPTMYTLDLAAPLVTVLTQQDAGGKKQYIYDLGDSPLAGYDGTTWTYLSGRDGLNSVRQETDASGNVITTRSFDPYGVPLQGNGGAPFGYTGEQTDNTGLVFLRARYMQPGLGTFFSHDPWGGDDLQPESMNGWNYVEGNPVRYTDPSGLIAQTEVKEAEGILSHLQPYGITIDKDWGMISPGMGCGDTWDAGSWNIKDLRNVETAIHKFDDANNFGGPVRFNHAIQGHAKILRLGTNIGSSAPPGGWPADVVLDESTFSGYWQPQYAIFTVIHELGHVWDFRTHTALSGGLMNALGTLTCGGMGGCVWNPYANAEVPPGAKNGCTVDDIAHKRNKCDVPYAFTYGGGGAFFEGAGWEDWADSFASYIYPEYHRRVGWTNLVFGGIRQNYVRAQINNVH